MFRVTCSPPGPDREWPQWNGPLRRGVEFVYAPKHGSWLNVAERELSAMTRRCLDGRRIGELDELREEISAWSDRTNDKQRGVDRQFQIDEARTKLARLSPRIKTGWCTSRL